MQVDLAQREEVGCRRGDALTAKKKNVQRNDSKTQNTEQGQPRERRRYAKKTWSAFA